MAVPKRPRRLLSIGQDAKTPKGEKLGYRTAILYLAPANLSGFEVCPQRTAGCTAGCLHYAGRAGVFKSIAESRIAKTRWYFEDRASFMARLVKEIGLFVKTCKRDGMAPVVRLNGTSDIPWERVPITLHAAQVNKIDHLYPERAYDRDLTVFDIFQGVTFYDYTKATKRALAHARAEATRNGWPGNYHLTFSLTEDNDDEALKVLQAGGSVAAVFKNVLPRGVVFEPHAKLSRRMVSRNYNYTVPVIDGDEDDLRFLAKSRRVIVGLKAKGRAKRDTSGFVRS